MPMGVDVPTSRWLHRARWAAALVAIACCVVGVIWVYRAATAGDVFGALAGAGLCLGIIALDALAAAVFRLGALILRCTRRMEELDARLSAFELAADRTARAVNLVTDENMEAASLAAASLDRDMFPRLSAVDDDEEETHVSEDRPPAETGAAEPIPASNDGQQELDRLVHLEMNRLRDEFGGQVRSGDYAGALRTGERIATLFPDSTLAREFESVREPLTRRAAAPPADKPAEAV